MAKLFIPEKPEPHLLPGKVMLFQLLGEAHRFAVQLEEPPSAGDCVTVGSTKYVVVSVFGARVTVAEFQGVGVVTKAVV